MMNHRITLLKRAPGTDSVGRAVDEWSTVATVWADVRFQTGAEVLRANAEVAIKRASIRIRARSGVDPSWRVRYLDEDYNVKSALPDIDRAFLFLVCEGAV
jgi:SPP1 family predicted phage head-tail adaptor